MRARDGFSGAQLYVAGLQLSASVYLSFTALWKSTELQSINIIVDFSKMCLIYFIHLRL